MTPPYYYYYYYYYYYHQAFVNDDIGEYQGDGDGNSTGILPEDYYSEPIVSYLSGEDLGKHM